MSSPLYNINIYSSIIPESMRWLRLQGRDADVIKILKKAARFNGKVFPSEVQLKTMQKSDIEQNKGSVLDLFRPWKMLLFSSVQGFGW